jgi:hypothetical protein
MRNLKYKYGLSAAGYDDLLAQQGGVCAICQQLDPKGRRLAVDHCHETGRVRGLLCVPCNVGIGNLNDDPERLLAAVAYLQEGNG